MRRRSTGRALALGALAAGAIVLATAGGDAARATPDRWGAFEAARLVPALLAIGFFPGWYALARARSLGAWGRTALAVIVSALAACAAGTLALGTGVPLVLVARAFAAVTVACALASLFGKGRFSASDAGDRTVAAGPARAPMFLVAAWVGLVAVLYLVSPELRPRGDGWFHAAVAAHVAQVGVPPDDPWYAGQTLHYAWAMHVVVDVFVAAAPKGATPLGLLAGWSLLTALALGASVVAAGAQWARAAGEITRAPAAAGWALAVTVLGIHPLGFWIWLAESFIGHTRGLGEFVRPLTEGANSTLGALASYLPHASLAFFPDKFLIPTAFGFAYAAVVTALDALFLSTWPVATRAAVAGAAILGALVFHPLSGFALLGALVVAAAVDLVRGQRGESATISAACGASLLVASPYLFVVLRGRAGGAGPWLTVAPDMLLAVLGTGAIVLAFAWPELRRAGGPFAAGRARVGLVALLWLVASVTLGFVQRNETKFLSLGLLALAVPAGACAARYGRRAAMGLAIGFPTFAMAVTGFAREQGQGSLGARVPAPAVAEGYAWVAAHTLARDAFLEPQADGVADPVRDLLVHGPRPLVWGGDSYASNWGYPSSELAFRRRAASELAHGALSALSVTELAHRFHGDGRALYAVERGAVRPPASDKPGAWTRVYDGPAFALDRLDAAPSGAAAAVGTR